MKKEKEKNQKQLDEINSKLKVIEDEKQHVISIQQKINEFVDENTFLSKLVNQAEKIENELKIGREELENALASEKEQVAQEKAKVMKQHESLRNQQDELKLERQQSMDVIRKQNSILEAKQKNETVRTWLASLIDFPLASEDLYECIKDGIVLCTAMNSIKPNCIKKFHKNPKMAALQIENIETFLRACKEHLGFKDVALFRTNELFEKENMNKVVNVLFDIMKKQEKQ